MPIFRNFRHYLMIVAFTFVAGSAHARPPASETVSSPLTVDTKTSVPGNTLKPGTYSIEVVDRLTDRCILRIEDAKGKSITTFIGLLNAASPGGGAGAVSWAKGPDKKPALRGFTFGNGLTVEFVYPKEQAVALAKLNTSSVPAIDPESEGRPSVGKLSDADRQLVTLWTLSSTRVGPGEGVPAIEAKRYRPEPDTQLAQNSVPSQPLPAATRPAPAPAPAASTNDARTFWTNGSAKPKSRSVAARLPQTASDLPLILLFSTIFMATGLGLGAGRRVLSKA